MKKIVPIILILLHCNIVLGQKLLGEKIYNREYFKYFTILLRDTSTNSTNLFPNPEYINDFPNVYNEAYLIDSISMVECEKILFNNRKKIANKKYEVITGQKNETCKLIKSNKYKLIINNINENISYCFIRLYIGYIDEKGRKNVIIQFVTNDEYQRNKEKLDKEIHFIPTEDQLTLRYVLIQFQ